MYVLSRKSPIRSALYYRGAYKRRTQVCPNCERKVTYAFYPDSRLSFYCKFCGRLEGTSEFGKHVVFCSGNPDAKKD